VPLLRKPNVIKQVKHSTVVDIFRARLIYATTDEADAYMFYRCFRFFLLFFLFATKYETTAERIFMKLLPNDSGENVVFNIVTKWGLGPTNNFWGAKN